MVGEIPVQISTDCIVGIVDFCGIMNGDKSWEDPAEAFVFYTKVMKR